MTTGFEIQREYEERRQAFIDNNIDALLDGTENFESEVDSTVLCARDVYGEAMADLDIAAEITKQAINKTDNLDSLREEARKIAVEWLGEFYDDHNK